MRVRLEDNQALLFARSQVQEAEQRLKELRSRQRELDMDVETMRAKMEQLEKRLYGGTVHNPRELSGMEEEVKLLKSRKNQQEESLLEAMVQVDEAAASLTKARERLVEVETQRQGEQEHLLGEQDRLTAELSSLERQREATASQIQPPSLAIYERLRASKQGQAVARVERNMCQGCHITLPTGVLQQARAGQNLVQCNSCGRILYVS